jgi:hypothetical protein
MNQVTRNVVDMAQEDRRALEHIVGYPLAAGQSVVIQIVPAPSTPAIRSESSADESPTWWNICEGMTEEEIDQFDRAVNQRCKTSRNIDLT